MLIKLLLGLVAAYGLIAALLYLSQAWLIFPGMTLPSTPLDWPRPPERLTQAAADGAAQLHGMAFAPPGGSDTLVLGLGGNAQDAEELGQSLAARLPDVRVVVFHYRGYGPSGGRPSERALFADALAIHDAMRERYRPATVFAIGISLGSGVAAYLAAQRPLAGLLLITPFDSITALARARYPWLPVRLLLRHPFASAARLADNPTPVAVLTAEIDRVVPKPRSEALKAALPRLVYSAEIKGAQHNDLAAFPAYARAFAEAFTALRKAAAK